MILPIRELWHISERAFRAKALSFFIRSLIRIRQIYFHFCAGMFFSVLFAIALFFFIYRGLSYMFTLDPSAEMLPELISSGVLLIISFIGSVIMFSERKFMRVFGLDEAVRNFNTSAQHVSSENREQELAEQRDKALLSLEEVIDRVIERKINERFNAESSKGTKEQLREQSSKEHRAA